MDRHVQESNTHQVFLHHGDPVASAVPFKVEIIGNSGGTSGFGSMMGGIAIMFGLFAIAKAITSLSL